MFKGTIDAIHVVRTRGEAPEMLERATLVAGQGIEGDRYFGRKSKDNRCNLSLIEAEAISAIAGNEALLAWQDDALVPQWVAGPGTDSLTQLRDLHADDQVQSIRLHNTAECRLPFVDWIYGDLLAWLTAERIPLWISLADTPVTEIMDTLGHFPDLQVVLLGAHYTHTLALRPLLKALPNAHLELSRFENLGAVEALIGAFGAERFLYGSFYPRYAMGPMLFYLHHMAIDDSALAAICAKNLERLLGEIS